MMLLDVLVCMVAIVVAGWALVSLAVWVWAFLVFGGWGQSRGEAFRQFIPLLGYHASVAALAIAYAIDPFPYGFPLLLMVSLGPRLAGWLG